MRTLIKRTKKDRESKPSPLIKKTHNPYHSYLSRSRGVVDLQRKRIYKLASLSGMLGESVGQLAVRLGVPVKILGRWMIRDPRIQKAMQRGMDGMWVDVEMAAKKRALGFKQKKVSTQVRRDIRGNIIDKTTTTTVEHVLGDVGMQKFLLSKRMSKRYMDEKPEGTKIIINMDKDDEGL